MPEKKVRIEMKESKHGREGVMGYKSRLFREGKIYEVNESLAIAFIGVGSAAKTNKKLVEEKQKEVHENKAAIPEENK